jgi:cell shape-determining protein MreC
MTNIPVTDAVAQGDTVVSAGIGIGEERSAYPAGLLVGTVQAVEDDPNALTRTAFVRPAFDAATERLLVVLAFDQG